MSIVNQPQDTPSSSSSARGTMSDLSQADTQSQDSLSSGGFTSSGISILNPILTKDARTRSYLIGSIGCQDSLLGNHELLRYFPEGIINVYIVTWNMGSRPTKALNDLLLPESIMYVPDMYAVGIQEGPASNHQEIKEWETQMQTTIGPSHVLLHSVPLGVLHLAIFLRRDLAWFCSVPEDSFYNSRTAAANIVKTKGAIGISFCFFGTSFLFINSHLPAHESKTKERLDEYEKICSSLDLPRNLKPLKPRYVSKDVTGRFDCVFWFGDLNFRVERKFDETIQILRQVNQQDNPSYECLLLNDQLQKTIEKGIAFRGFQEPFPISFPPTYKFTIGKDTYDTVTQRVPSFTDRILYKTKRPGHVNCVLYDWIPQVKTSDHRPVMALMRCQLRPGRDNIPLNAGSFNRNIYLEALNRRAEEIESEADERRGSFVCVLS